MVEDDPGDAELLALELAREAFTVEHERVDSQAAMLAALERGGWDVILADWHVPGFGTAGLLERARRVPVFAFTMGPKSAPTSSMLREPRSSGVSLSAFSSDVPDFCAGVVPPAEAGPPRRHRDKQRGARGGAASVKHPRVRVAAGSEAESSRAPLGVAADSPTGLAGQKPWDDRARHAATLASEL